MKKFLVFIFSCFAASALYSQKIEIFYDDPCQYVVDVPTYLFQRISPAKNNITITDSTFFDYVARMVGNFSKCESSCCKSHGCLEMNGKIMEFSREFQEIMDEIVNCHITRPSSPIKHRLLIELIQGKRYHLAPYLSPWVPPYDITTLPWNINDL